MDCHFMSTVNNSKRVCSFELLGEVVEISYYV